MLSTQKSVRLHEEFSKEYRKYSEIFDRENITNALYALKELVSQRIDYIIEEVPLHQTSEYLIRILTSLDVIRDDKFIHHKVREVVSDYIKIMEKWGHGYISQWDNIPMHHINKKISRRYRGRDTERRNKVLNKMREEIRGSGDIIYSPLPS